MENREDFYRICKFWKRRNVKTAKDVWTLINGKLTQFVYNTAKIENKSVTMRDTKLICEKGKVENFSGELRTLYEIDNTLTALKFMLTAFETGAPLDEKFVRDMQHCICRNTYDSHRLEIGELPGNYRINEFRTGIDGDVGVDCSEIKCCMDKLLAEINEYSGDDPDKTTTAAAYFHAEFESIHPFADGNGRTGRMLLNYFLLRHNMPPVNIFDKDKSLYYIVLDAYHLHGALSPLEKFLVFQTEKTWDKEIEAIKEAEQCEK